MKVQSPIIVTVKFQKPLILSPQEKERANHALKFVWDGKEIASQRVGRLKGLFTSFKDDVVAGYTAVRNRHVYPY